MSVERQSLPHDTATLHSMVNELTDKVEQQSLFIDQLLEQIRLARHQHFGVRSERFSIDQLALPLNDGTEHNASKSDAVDEAETGCKPPARTKQRSGRRPLPDWLPRVEIIHTLDDSQCQCEQCHQDLTVIGEKVSEQLDIEKAKARVLRHVSKTYRCEHCEGVIQTASAPAQPIPGSMASPATLTHVATTRFVDSVPYYRQSKQLKRMGLDVSRSTLAQWMIKVGLLIQPLINLLIELLLSQDYIGMDETRAQVLKEPGKTPQSRSYLWVQRGGPPGQTIVIYTYDPSRSGDVATRLLEGFSGYLQIDGYEGYRGVIDNNGLTALGCWAHTRRKFDEALKAQVNLSPEKKKQSLAAVALEKIQGLYRIERETAALHADERREIRQMRSLPLLDEFRDWLDQKIPIVPVSSALGKALRYADKQWPRLTTYTQDGRLRMDNNLTENAIRPFVIGRKNSLFFDSVAGANAGANIYTLIETAKANGLEPSQYLNTVFTELPQATTLEQIEALLPISREPLEQSLAG